MESTATKKDVSIIEKLMVFYTVVSCYFYDVEND